MTPSSDTADKAGGLAALVRSTAHVGAKIALVCGQGIVTYRRDAKDTIPDPGLWDLPGGVREADETALACALRETREEFGIDLPAALVSHGAEYEADHSPGRKVAFFGARIDRDIVASIVFGDEGQYWRLMPLDEYLARPDAIAALQRQVARFVGPPVVPRAAPR